MNHFRVEYLFKALDHFGYLVLLLVGCYFIYEGNIVERFQQRKTNFAEAVENVTEYPTIVTWIEYQQPREVLTLGSDFNLSISLDYSEGIYLKDGQNFMDGDYSTMFNLEEIPYVQTLEYPHQYFRISPKKNSAKTSLVMSLEYDFSNSSMTNTSIAVARIGSVFTSQNNSRCGYAYRHDGDSKFVSAKIGETKWLTMHPEKYLFTPECRGKPYSELVLQKIAEEMIVKCNMTCRGLNFWICRNTSESINLPICKNEEDISCFENMAELAERVVLKKPCTKLQYRVEIKDTTKSTFSFHSVLFHADIDTVAVKEEYVIYDMVQMIGAIGGTMGLCIGFSFKEVYSFFLVVLEAGLNRIQKKNSTKNQISPRWASHHRKVPEGYQTSSENVQNNMQDIRNDIKRIETTFENRLLKIEQKMNQ